MLCPDKVLRINEFSRDIINGIIWDDVRDRKVHPNVLFKMGLQQKYGLSVTKKMVREQEMEKLNQQTGRESHIRSEKDYTENQEEREKDQATHKDLFANSIKKHQFFEVAKQMHN